MLPGTVFGPYEISGYNNVIHNYDTVHFPRDIRGCAACHDSQVAPDSEPAGDPGWGF